MFTYWIICTMLSCTCIMMSSVCEPFRWDWLNVAFTTKAVVEASWTSISGKVTCQFQLNLTQTTIVPIQRIICPSILVGLHQVTYLPTRIEHLGFTLRTSTQATCPNMATFYGRLGFLADRTAYMNCELLTSKRLIPLDL